MDDHDARISRLELKVENTEKICARKANSIDALRSEMNQGLDQMNQHISDLRTEFEKGISDLRAEFTHAIDRLREENNRNFRWPLGVV